MFKPISYLVLSGLLMLSACSVKEAAHTEHGKMNHTEMDHSKMNHSEMDHSQHEAMDAGTPSDMSLYLLESTWTNQNNQKVNLKDLGNRTQLIAMVYASCKNACPRIIVDMKRIEEEVKARYSEEVNLVLVSIDPEVDTPEKLKALSEKSQLSDSWQLLQGDEESVLELATLLGVKYKKISATDYAHSNIISVLNTKGEILHQQMGLGVDPEATLKVLEKAKAS